MGNLRRSASLSRRRFGMLAGSAALPLLGRERRQTPPPQTDYVPPPRPLLADAPPFPGPLAFTRQPVTPAVEPFPMSQVRLLPGSVFHDAQEWNRGYMARLAADRLLYTFRVNAGLPTGSAKPLGGWEQPENGRRSSELRGHFVGHFLSASALLYASTGDTDGEGEGRLHGRGAGHAARSGWAADTSARFPRHGGIGSSRGAARVGALLHDPQDHGRHVRHVSPAGNQQALRVLEGMAAWADEWTAPKTEEHMQQILAIEFGGIAATLYNLAAVTGNDRWATVGDRFQKRSFINPLALRRDELRGLHANTHIPQAIAAARRYEISGDMRFHDVADVFLPRGDHGALVRDRRHQQRRRLAGAAAAAGGGTAGQREHGRMLLRLQHAEAGAASVRLAPGAAVLRLLRAPAAESPHRHDPAEGRHHAVLPLAHAGRLEDLQHRGPDVLVLHGHRASRNTPSSPTASTGATMTASTSTCSSRRSSMAGEAASASSGDAISRNPSSTALTVVEPGSAAIAFDCASRAGFARRPP